MSNYFPEIETVQYEGPDTKNLSAFRYYNPDELVGGKTMQDHFRFSMAYWHTLTGEGNDPFGVGTAVRPWHKYSDPMDIARVRLETGFEFMRKIGMPYFCFHDRDIAPEGSTLGETNRNLDVIVDLMEGMMKDTGIKLLWGTANLFSHPRYMHGAATSCSADVFAYAAAQVKKALEITQRLGGQNYVFWGGREGYETLLNTDLALEQDNLARFFSMAVDYAKAIGFTGQFLIEPKPKEPTKHQYDFDSANVVAFLRKYELLDHFKLNIETNHATLAGHTFQHELRFARENGVLGSVDANQGDLLLGWDTDQFPTNLYVTIFAMYEVLMAGGLKTGGFNFDAKVRRGSYRMDDLFHGHIVGMDTFARGLKIAQALLDDGGIEQFIKERYSSFSSGMGASIVSRSVGFKELEDYAMGLDQITLPSGRQEMLENLVNRFI